MTALIVPLAYFLTAAIGTGAVMAWLLWQPVPPEVQKRVETAMRNVVAHQPERHRQSGALPTALEALKRLFTLRMTHKWGVNVSPLILALVALIAGGCAWLVGHAIAGLSVWVAFPVAVFAAWYAPHKLALMEQENEDKRFLELFPDAIDMIVRVMRAGLPVSVAIRTVAREAAAPIDTVFTSLADQIDIGIAFEDALDIASERIGLPDFRFFAAAVALQRTTGGNLPASLEILAEIIRRRRTVRLKARAATAEVRISAYVLASIPFIVFGSLLIVSPSYLKPLLDDRRGNVILVVAVLLLLSALLTMRQMMRSAIRV